MANKAPLPSTWAHIPHACLFARFPGEGWAFHCEQENDGDKEGEISNDGKRGKKKHWKKCSQL